MNRTTSISVIVPSYNCGPYLAEAIGSILSQTVPVNQIIVVDDGSTDDTAQVVGLFPQVQYIRKANGGISSARNAGLDVARGEFITFLDADDRWRPGFVERMHSLLRADPAAVCGFANFVRFDHETRDLLGDQFRMYPESLRTPFGWIPKSRAFKELVSCQEFPAYMQVTMFRRSLIKSLRFNERLMLGEDSNFALSAFMRGNVVFTNDVLAEVRRHTTNTTRDYREMVVHTLNSLRALTPHVTGANLAAFRDRLVKSHISAAIYQASTGRVRDGLRNYRDGLRVRGAPMRKIKGAVRMAMALI